MKFKIKKLIPVYGSTYCQYSLLENDLEKLYKNQELIYKLLIAMLKFLIYIWLHNDYETGEEMEFIIEE